MSLFSSVCTLCHAKNSSDDSIMKTRRKRSGFMLIRLNSSNISALTSIICIKKQFEKQEVAICIYRNRSRSFSPGMMQSCFLPKIRYR